MADDREPKTTLPKTTQPKTTLIDDGRRATVSPPCAIVRVTSGPDVGKGAQVAMERVTVGAHQSCAIVLTDPSASRFHFEVGYTPKGLLLTDLDSTNGTFVLGLRVKAVFVEPGAVITAGRTTLAVSRPEKEVEVKVSPSDRLGNLVGASVPMRRLYVAITRVAQHGVPVLVSGETGTGKEVVAREIHAQSDRRDGPFVIVDCGAIPRDLAESELFGHAKGAFSGATGERRGAFESADGGTLFLDEIGELDLELQPRLLRAVETRKVKRVGSDTYRDVNVRVIAATHRDLRVAVNQGTFREDLYYRLAVATLHVPPVRERPGDIPLLMEHFYMEAARSLGLPRKELPMASEELARLVTLPWSGNCREIRNYVDRCLVFGGEEGESGAHGLTAATSDQSPVDGSPNISVRLDLDYRGARAACIGDFERAFIAHRVRMAGGNVSRAAREMGIDRVYVMQLIKRHNLR